MDPITLDSAGKIRRALVVEDEAAIAQLLRLNLIDMGLEVETCGDAEAALEKLRSAHFDLCLVDWMLPGLQGVEFVKKVRPQYSKLKLMMVTAKADPDSIVAGLESGADDYMTKPFEAKVLTARVRNLLRRIQAESSTAVTEKTSELSFDGLHIHFARHTVTYMGKEVHLTPSEFKLLTALFKAQGLVLTREQLIDLIQGEDVSVTGRTIDTHIFSLRKKLGAWAQHIETIRGVGYRILISAADSSEPEVM